MASPAPRATKDVILVTGGNAGLGFQCCLALAKRANTHVILAGRNEQRVQEAVNTIQAQATASSVVEPGIVDLSSLASVRAFSATLVSRNLMLSAIVCNAGVNAMTKRTTPDGFESTFAVNHLGHFLLVSLLRERVTQRIVVVSSEMHDPNDAKMATLLDLTNLDSISTGEQFSMSGTYSTSKLFNLLFVKEFVRRFPLPVGPEIVAFTPSFVPDTSLARELNFLIRPIIKFVIGIITRLNGGRISSPEYAGGIMAKLAADQSLSFGASNGDYIRVDEVFESSATAKDPVLGALLWEKSEKWIAK
jgi:NAD(P)-dependent dehydrogenase (short-subunit alcohol dehydrogenase family)